MKKSLVARGFIGAVASLLGVAAVGCGAATDEQGAEIGSTEQAIGIPNLDKPSDDVAAGFYTEAKFPAYLAISSNKVLVVSGYDHTGSAVAKAAIYDESTDAWVEAGAGTSTTPRARGEAAIALIPGTDKVLVAGGRSSDSGNTFLATADIYDISADEWTQVTASMVEAVSNFTMNTCGTGSKLLGIAGLRNGAVSNKLQVFSFDSSGNGKGAGSTWAQLQDSTPANLTLANGRAFHGTVPLDSTHLLVVDGETSNGTIVQSVEQVTVNNSCAGASKAAKDDLTTPRSRFASALMTDATYKAVVVGGTTTQSDALDSAERYDQGNNLWVTAGSVAAGKGTTFPILVPTTSGNFTLVGGKMSDDATNHANSSDFVATFAQSGTTWTTAGTLLTTARYAHWAAFINSSVIVGHGVNATGTTPTISFTGLDQPE